MGIPEEEPPPRPHIPFGVEGPGEAVPMEGVVEQGGDLGGGGIRMESAVGGSRGKAVASFPSGG